MQMKLAATMQFTVTYHILILSILLEATTVEGFWPQTYTGDYCMDQCLKRGYDYYWCHTDSTWGYCSPFNNMSSSGKMCRRYHPCQVIPMKSDYMQCELEDGGIDHCGLLDQYVDVHSVSTTYEAFCTDGCTKRGYSYYWCHTFKGWDYCSPFRDTTLNGVPCLDNHYCAKHGYTYHWCYTSSGWDYCGTVVDCSYWPAEDQLGNKTECIISKEQQKIKFEYEPDITIDQVRRHDMRQEALLLIEDWNYDKIDRNWERGTLFQHDILRIDQGYAEGGNFAIILLQIIKDRPEMGSTVYNPGTGSTLAKVLLPTDTTMNYMIVRRALANSLNQRERVTLRISQN